MDSPSLLLSPTLAEDARKLAVEAQEPNQTVNSAVAKVAKAVELLAIDAEMNGSHPNV